MKTLKIVLFTALFLCLLTVAASAEILWDFTQEETLDYLDEYVSCGSIHYDECLVYEIRGTSPYFTFLPSEEIAPDTSIYNFVKIRFKVQSEMKKGAIYFETDQIQQMGAAMIPYEIEANGEWETVIIDIPLTKGSLWQGILNRFMYAPLHYGDEVGGETVYIDYIAFFETRELAEAYEGPSSEDAHLIKKEQVANNLKELGLFIGTENGFELDREPTRIEALVMLIRLLGLEDDAKNGTYSHPFTDVPDWAAPYVGYAYEKGLTAGVSDILFGTDELSNAAQYLTFVLRALGYSDANGDFIWNKSNAMASFIGLIDTIEFTSPETDAFLRDDVANISYAALTCNLKGSDTTLIESLIDDGAVEEAIAKTQELLKSDVSCDSYNMCDYLDPYWTGSVMYNEALIFIEDENGVASANLMYTPTNISEIRSSDLRKVYLEGVDYTVNGKTITLTENSNIKHFTHDEWFLDSYVQNESWPAVGGGAQMFREGTYLHSCQVAVTYTYDDEWSGPIPTYLGDGIQKSIEKLENGEPIKIVFYGDSITQGGNASGLFGALPNCPQYAVLVADMLKVAYPKANIEFVNVVMANTDSVWANTNLQEYVLSQNPDLLFVAFGMNDGGSRTPADFVANMKKLRTSVLAKRPDCEFVFISTSLANDELLVPNTTDRKMNTYQPEYYDAMTALNEDGSIVVNVTEIHEHLLTLKRFCDMSGNNVNHPNDFLHRAYAQTILTAIVEDYNTFFSGK